MSKVNPRELAATILTRVEQEKAFSNLLLQKNLGRLEELRDRQLATILVNGVLKNRLTLDYALRQHLDKAMSSLPHNVRSILRLGAFQILYLDKIPPAAAINESVELANRLHAKYSGLVNAVLRKVYATGWEIIWPSTEKEPVRYLSIRYSHPDWMVKRWYKRWGLVETEKLCKANNEPAPTFIRTNTLRTSREALMERLTSEGVKVKSGNLSPESLVISDFGALEALESFKEGLFTVQDESSQLIAHLLEPQPGHKVLDACSAPGGKSTHLAQLMDNRGEIYSFDLYPHKLQLIDELAARLGITIISSRLGDARELPGIPDKSMDRVLVDAPCSGLGVIRRKADLRWQKDEKDLTELPLLQLEILNRAAACVSAGGILVYSTCTIEPEENFEVVKLFKSTQPDFEPVSLQGSLPFSLQDERDIRQAEKGILQILPHRHGTDGFFFSKFRRREV
ncbi:MAG: 16S rRNA (cytosine(967)-C(5))-methyltransferase RsmB [Desulfitobacterium hafniense]|nr:16S rRNA (cytosine(967)-C(5))-methyltransferase RsmB [Desulfitobacterium hafniense]